MPNPKTFKHPNRFETPKCHGTGLNAFVWKNKTFSAPAIYQNCTKCCACHEKWQCNFRTYYACRAKWISWLIRVTYATSATMRGASKVTLDSELLYSELLDSELLDSELLYSALCYSELLYSELLYSELLYSILRYPTLSYCTLTLLWANLLWAILLCAIVLWATWLLWF